MRNFARSLFAGAVMFLTATSAFAQKSYTREDLTSDVIRLEEQFRKDAGTIAGNRTAEDLRRDGVGALQRNPRGAIRSFSAAIAASPRDASLWLLYARAAFSSAQ